MIVADIKRRLTDLYILRDQQRYEEFTDRESIDKEIKELEELLNLIGESNEAC